jgi:hypothetical protein
LIRREGEQQWRELKVTPYENEAVLQTLLERSPDLLPGFSEKQLVVAREHSVPTGSVDLVAVDTEGNIAVVECKLKTNPEIKRKVVGQLLEYASEIWRSSYDDFDARFRRTSQQSSEEPGRSLEEQVRELADAESWSSEEFQSTVAANLEAGRFHLVFAVDQITEELKGVVEFLNAQTVPELKVLALALEYAKDGDVEFLLPHVYGEEATRAKMAREAEHWSLDRLLEAAATRFSPEVADVLQQLITWCESKDARVELGTGTTPTVKAVWFNIGGQSIRVWRTSDGGTLNPVWADFRNLLGDEKAKILEEKIRKISPDIDAALPPESWESWYKGFPLWRLVGEGRVEKFERALEETFDL